MKQADWTPVKLVICFGIITLSGSSIHSSEAQSTLWLDAKAPAYESDRLTHLLRRIGPNMRASTDYHDFNDVQLNESLVAWQLLHDQVMVFAQNQVQLYKPKLELLLAEANVSLACRIASKQVLDSLGRLDSWPALMWSASGSFPPVGLFDGQFGDIGSYKGCIDLPATLPASIGHTSYCSLSFRPVVPNRPRFHQVFEQLDNKLLNLFKKTDVIASLAHRAQFFNYVYMKTGVCVPYQCSSWDLQRVAGVISSRLALMVGPVKCFTRALSNHTIDAEETNQVSSMNTEEDEDKRPILIEIDKPMNLKQRSAAILVCSFYLLVLLATLWHAAELSLCAKVAKSFINGDEELHIQDQLPEAGKQQIYMAKSINVNPQSTHAGQDKETLSTGSAIKRIAFQYLSVITNLREFLDTSMRPNEIKCLHGLRVMTMVWIICVHTFQYCDWSGFTRIFETVETLQNPILHPIYNANYVVDNFFLMSGLLVSYTNWFANKGSSLNFNPLTNLVGRYLRLTPQVFLISLLYIILPLLGHGPFWYDTTHYMSKNCERNWWINLLHLQSFYRTDEICNLVGWWISIDMLYYILALAIIYLILSQQQKRALLLTLLIVSSFMSLSVYRHFRGNYTPNNLGTVPQVAEVWSEYVLYFFWSPFPHVYPFFFGLWLGHVLANNKWRFQVRRWSHFGWTLSILCLVTVNLSSHLWMSGLVKLGDQYISTGYNNICSILWASSYGWIIMACHYGSAPRLNKLLSIELFVLLSKASFIIYLSHMLVISIYFGTQYSLLELSIPTLSYTIVGNTFFSGLFGIFLCITFEGPFMKFQRFIVQSIKPTRSQLPPGANYAKEMENQRKSIKENLSGFGPASKALLK